MLILAFLLGGWAVGVIWGARLIALSFAIHNMVQLYQMYQSTGEVIFLQEMLIQISAICTLGLIRIGPMEDLFAETAALKGIIAQMKAEGVPTSTTLNFLKTYGVGRAQQATQTLGYFKKYGLLDNQLLNLSQGFDRANIIAIENAYIKSLVKFTPQDTDAILILFKQTVGLGNASNLSNNIVALSNSGIVPSAYNIYGIVGTNGVSSAVIALIRGIPAPVMKRLGDLGIKTTDYERLGIRSKETAEGVAEAVANVRKLDIYSTTLNDLRVATKGFVNETIDEFMSKFGTSIKSNPLRFEYESKVNGLADVAKNLRNQGKTSEEIARTMSKMRRELGVQYKNASPPTLKDYIYEVNMNRYGDELGPTFDYLLEKYAGDYEKIIEASCRPNPNVDALLGGFKEWLIGKLK